MSLKTQLSNLTCSICASLYVDPVTTPCDHTFCTSCLTRIFSTSHQCPMCRYSLDVEWARLLIKKPVALLSKRISDRVIIYSP